MADKKSFILYLDNKKQLDMLTDEQAGKLIKALFEFAESGTVPEFNDGMLIMAFSFMSDSIARDSEKYKQKCERLRQNRIGKTKDNICKQKITNENNCNFQKQISGDNDNVNDNDNDNDIVIVNENDNEIMTTTTIPPDIEEVKEYCRERGNKIDVEYFFDYYGSKGWKCGKSPMTDWKAVIRTWERRENNDGNKKSDTSEPDGLYVGII